MRNLFQRRKRKPTLTREQFNTALENGIDQALRDNIGCVYRALAHVAPDAIDAFAERLDWELSQHAARALADGPISDKRVDA